MPTSGDADVVLRLGEVAPALPNPTWLSPFVEIGDRDTILIRAGGLRFLLRHGREIVLDAPPGSHAGEIETFLFSIVAGALMHQRGELALHASCVVIGHRAIAMAGPSGRGKSTMAAALVAAGHALLSDDICRLCITGDQAFAAQGPARIRLWPDALRQLGQVPDTLERGRPGHNKRVLPADGAPAASGVPLAAIVRLRVDRRLAEGRLERLTGPAAIMPADELVYRVRLGRQLGRGVDLFQQLIGIGRTTPVFALTRGDAPTDLSHLASLIESVVADC
jgi:hypothetical protein